MSNQTVDFPSQNMDDSPCSQSTSSSLHEESSSSLSESQCPSPKDSNRHLKFTPIVKKPHFTCFTLNLLEEYGAIQFIAKPKQFYISKLQKVVIEDNYNDLFDKGKSTVNNSIFQQEIGSVPDMNFWYQRYYYYSKFDEGIKMDYESWYSVTPEPIAKYIANMIKGKTVIDGFCGSGGNVIQFSKYCKKVYAIDIDEKKIDICKNNCKVYNCSENIDFILSDYLKMKGQINADYVFLSPPWGGIKYKDSEVYKISKSMTPSIYDIIRTSLSIAKNIIFYVPRNLDLEELFDIVSFIQNENSPSKGNTINFDVKILKSNKKIKALLIVFGYDLSDIVNDRDLTDYLITYYDYATNDNLRLLTEISKVIGLNKFFHSEFFFRNKYGNAAHENNINYLVKHFFNYCMSDKEKVAVKMKTMPYQGQASQYKDKSQSYNKGRPWHNYASFYPMTNKTYNNYGNNKSYKGGFHYNYHHGYKNRIVEVKDK